MKLMSDVRRPDRRALTRLLSGLDAKYPSGLAWLDRRMDDIEAGRARLHQVMIGDRLAAVGIETPKAPHCLKLSTFMVAHHARGAGLGRTLLEAMKDRWRAEEIDQVIVTVDERDSATIHFFLRAGFACVEGARAVFEPDRADIVLRWEASPG